MLICPWDCGIASHIVVTITNTITFTTHTAPCHALQTAYSAPMTKGIWFTSAQGAVTLWNQPARAAAVSVECRVQ